MKKVLFFLTILIFCLWFFQNTPTAWAQAPTISLKDSISIAEDTLAKAKIDLSNYYLYAIVYTHSSKGYYWYCTYRPKTPSEYGQIFVKVYMDRTTEVVGGSPTKQR